MAVLTGDQEYRKKAMALLESASSFFAVYPQGFGHWLGALDLALASPMEVAVVGPLHDPSTGSLLRTIHSRFLPNRLLVGRDPADADIFPTPILEGRKAVDGLATAYVCHGYVCELPTTDPSLLDALLSQPVPGG